MQCLSTPTRLHFNLAPPPLSLALCTWPVISSMCFLFFCKEKMNTNKSFMKTFKLKSAYQHKNHSQLLNWAKTEGSG